jgi:NTP pyrophosphatase (non-canonical NTP hydrolase)
MSGYHVTAIKKSGVLSPYKLVEESIEFVDALASGNRIMAMVELSDLYGMVKQMANRLNVTIEDIDAMSKATTDAFTSKSRPSFGNSKDWLDWIFANTSSYAAKDRSIQFKVLDDIYIIFTETAHIPCVSTGGLRPDYTHIFELLVGEAHFFAGRPPIQKGQVYHHTNQTVECQGGSIVRITSTRKAGRPEMSKAAEQEFIKVRDKIKTRFGV